MLTNLSAYLSRIGHDASCSPSLTTLCALQARHVCAIPFENIDVLCGSGVRLDQSSIGKKLIADRRGGYCFEQNMLFASVLTAIGFRVTLLAARVRWQIPPDVVMPRTHMVLLVDLDEEPWLVDVGFGGLTPTAPVRLEVTEPQSTPHEMLRILKNGNAYILQAQVDAGWSDVYEFTLDVQHPSDYEIANWFTSTHPKSRFTQNLVVARSGNAGQRLSLLNRDLVIRNKSSVERRLIGTHEELIEVLGDQFGLRLPNGNRIEIPGVQWPS
jgi:N-hydroxyarylamine O-acetyltransferase